MDRIKAEKCKQSDRLADEAFEELENLGLSYASHSIIGMALGKLKAYEYTELTPKQVRELQEADGRNCTSDCPYNTGRPCPAADGCPGYEEKRYCNTCRWYDVEIEVCCSGESDHRADFRDWNDTCDNWEGNRETD